MRHTEDAGIPVPREAIAVLDLSADEIQSLVRQGFVSREARNGTNVYKLRFRHQGRQRVRSLGSNPQRAADVRAALAELQNGRKWELRSRRRIRQARQLQREIKQRLLACVTAAGFRFHGRTIRRPRSAANSRQSEVSQF
ncbi:MAG TPA: hypothetical protein VMP01_23145 [Pirellulaceae bacterium]|nr:hypothetical protein [Pirellulaceae bacterium]